jgi:DNA-binding transcriptional ArsR family regulator
MVLDQTKGSMKNISSIEKMLVTIPLSLSITKGLSDPNRIKILDLLYHRELSTSEILVGLKKSNYKIAETTLRHHINVLKKSGLIKISKTKEINGIIVKYYKAKAKILFVTDFPFESIVSDNSAIIQSLYPRFYKIITELLINKKSLILKASKSKTICKICKINHQHEFILFLIFSVVITMVLNNILKK